MIYFDNMRKILLILSNNESLSLSEIMRSANSERIAVLRWSLYLEKLGLVKRDKPRTRRLKYVFSITSKGKKLLNLIR